MLAIRRKKRPETHWRVTEARLALEKIRALGGISPEKRQQLVKAEQVLGDSWERLKPGRFMWTELPPWCPPIEVAVELQRQLFGEKDLDYAAGCGRSPPSWRRRIARAQRRGTQPESPGNSSGAAGRKTPRCTSPGGRWVTFTGTTASSVKPCRCSDWPPRFTWNPSVRETSSTTMRSTRVPYS